MRNDTSRPERSSYPRSFLNSQFSVLSSAVVLLLSSTLASAWPGHVWEQWREVTTWTKPQVETDQTGQSELVPLLSGGDARIDGIKAWEEKRAGYARAIGAILGSPGDLKPPKPEAQVLGEEELDDHIRRHIRIRSEEDDWIPAYLLIPKHRFKTGATNASSQLSVVSSQLQGTSAPGKNAAGAGSVPRTTDNEQLTTNQLSPVMICLHQTVAEGKQEPAGITGKNPDLDLALQLVRRGFVCVVPDAIGFGERIRSGGQPYDDSLAFYRRHPGWSFMGKMIWDVSRVIDWLETCDFVDPLQIGCIGHSHGAYGTLFATAFEPRIAAAIASCGFTTFRSDPALNRWSHLTALIPQLGLYLDDPASIPFDWQHVCALIAPRPQFVWYATQDTIFPETDNLDALFRDVRSVYGLYGAADDLAWHAFDGPHRFTPEGREKAYRWLDERLFPIGDLSVLPNSPQQWGPRRELVKRVIRRSTGVPTSQPVPPDVRVLSSETLANYERRLIEYSVSEDERVKAYLCVPTGASKARPGVLVLHQTSPEGKLEAVGLAGDGSLAFGVHLAERGYVTLSPDSITAGERIDGYGAFDTRGHYLRQPGLSAMGKMLWDAQRALDVLAATDGVDPALLGTIGHSLGAEEALMLAAFDDRVKATVSSCGYATFEAEKNRLRWARDAWFSYMPKLRPVFATGRLPHWDWDDVLRLMAPRALFQHTTEQDQIFPESRSAYEAGETARDAWRLLNAPPTAFVNVLRPGQHAISEKTRAEMYAWLDEQLKK